MNIKNEKKSISIPRATGLLIIAVENSNPNGDPDQENDPRRRSHDQRGMITGVSFKRKLRDLVLRKDETVWPIIASKIGIEQNEGNWGRDGYSFDILEQRETVRGDVEKYLKNDLDAFKKRYWDARVFGNTFLEEKLKRDELEIKKHGPDTIRTGVAQFGLAVSVAPVRVHRLTKTKMAPAEKGHKEGEEGPSRGMAPLAHRVVEHGVYCMPFFINPTGTQGKRGTGCTALDICLLLMLIRYAYPHTKSDIRPLVEVMHAWYAEHIDDIGSFSEFEFIEHLRPAKLIDSEKPSVSGVPLERQYRIPTEIDLGDNFLSRIKYGKLFDLCAELPNWCVELEKA